jgi:alpha-galactosidase
MNKMKLKSLFLTALVCIGSTISVAAQQIKDTTFAIGNTQTQVSFAFLQNKYLRQTTLLASNTKSDVKLPDLTMDAGNLVFLQLTGENRSAHHGVKLIGGSCGTRLQFAGKTEKSTIHGKQIIITEKDSVSGLTVDSYFEFNDASPVIRRYTVIKNNGTVEVGIEYASSAMLYNYMNQRQTGRSLEKNLKIYHADNSWMQEAQWKMQTPGQLGWNDNTAYNLNGIFFSNLGSWSSVRYLPMGMVENIKENLTWFWQIEHNGSWHAEMSSYPDGSDYLYAGGPDAIHSQALKILKPGETYQTVPVAIGCVKGSFNEAVAALTLYRRNVLLTAHENNKTCPVIFNDYMNCLYADPTTEKELPYIKAAAKVKADYYVIDAGWYAEINKGWWDAVGEWQPSKTRFSTGLNGLIDSIKRYGLVPGLWLEPEVVGINSSLKNKPDNWFLMMYGKRVIDNGRFLLDFRNPEVVQYMTAVVDRMVNEIGAGYIKMDYNNLAWGTETNASSAGQGLLENNRAVANWYKLLSEKYPRLVIENCASGGNRMDYAMLQYTQLQSSSDQTLYTNYPAIITGCMAAVLPEQLAAWAYPLANADEAEASFNMVTAMLCRIHLSGKLAELNSKNFELVKEGIGIYKSTIQKELPASIPFFPLGLPSMADDAKPVSVGLQCKGKKLIAVWRLKGNNNVSLNIKGKQVKLLYPRGLGIKLSGKENAINVIFPKHNMAAIIEVTE